MLNLFGAILDMGSPKKREQIVVERHTFDELVIYEVTGQELDQMEQETLTVGEDFSFALSGLSIGITLGSVLATVPIESNRVFNVFVILMVLGFLVALYCGVRWLKARRKFTGVVTRIRTRLGPLGEEGKEIDPQQLENLPPAEVNKR